MGGKMFGRRRQPELAEPWSNVPTGVRQSLEAVLHATDLGDLAQILARHDLTAWPTLWKSVEGLDQEGRSNAIALLLSTLLIKAMERDLTSKADEAQRLCDISLSLNTEPWNPAWAWKGLFMGPTIEDKEAFTPYIENGLSAFDAADREYRQLFGTNPAYTLVPPEVRSSLLYLQLEKRLAARLAEDDLETLVTALHTVTGETIAKRALMGHFAHDDQPSELALRLGERATATLVYLLGGEYMKEQVEVIRVPP